MFVSSSAQMPPRHSTMTFDNTISTSIIGLEIDVQQDDDQRQRHGDHDHQPLFGVLHFLELAAPLDAIGRL